MQNIKMYLNKSSDKITRLIQKVGIKRKRNQTSDGGRELGGGGGEEPLEPEERWRMLEIVAAKG
jgi:hypothetical protein